MSELTLVARFALAALFGFAIGIERELRGKAAGLRTFALVALGAAAFTGIGLLLLPESVDRVIQGVVTGVGFLGAGIIFQRERGIIEGLTTAASAWAAAAVGVLVGAGAYIAGASATVLILVVLQLDRLRPLRRVHRSKREERRSASN